LNNELANGAIGLAVILTDMKAVWAGPLRNRLIGCLTGFVEGLVGTIPMFEAIPQIEIRKRRCPPTISSPFSPLALVALLECAYLLFD
jgi:hypothetical protein